MRKAVNVTQKIEVNSGRIEIITLADGAPVVSIVMTTEETMKHVERLVDAVNSINQRASAPNLIIPGLH